MKLTICSSLAETGQFDNVNKPFFNTEYRKALIRAGLSIAAGARELSIARPTLLKYLKRNQYPESLFPRMCALVNLRGRSGEPLDCAEAEAIYALGKWLRSDTSPQGFKATKAGTLRESFSRIDAAQENGSHRGAADDMAKVLKLMGAPRHALVVFTASIEPLVFRCFSQSPTSQQTVDAILGGMHLCVIIPTRKVIEERYRNTYGLDDLYSYDAFLASYQGFRTFARERWQQAGRSSGQADEIFYSSVVQVESEDCPFHTPGWTYSLFVSAPPDGECYRRALYRTPAEARAGWRVNRQPHADEFLFERRLAKAAVVALRDAEPHLPECVDRACTNDTRQRCVIRRLIAMLEYDPGDMERESTHDCYPW